MYYRVIFFNDPFPTSSQGCIFLNIDMRFGANCRYRTRDFFIYDTWRYLTNCGNSSDLKKSGTTKHMEMWNTHTQIITNSRAKNGQNSCKIKTCSPLPDLEVNIPWIYHNAITKLHYKNSMPNIIKLPELGTSVLYKLWTNISPWKHIIISCWNIVYKFCSVVRKVMNQFAYPRYIY